jgi:enamine deaminase RidA (YjgF/YER057c/UK114 family)
VPALANAGSIARLGAFPSASDRGRPNGNIGYTAGIIGQSRDTGELVSDDVSQQCDAMLTNLQILLDEQGLTLNDLLRTTSI